ncbi:MAG: zinc-binding dehydrogenase [Desulfurococcales archaeon]|nr:zinc-binding dehydrogenase [Desulfurococcales archaeon]
MKVRVRGALLERFRSEFRVGEWEVEVPDGWVPVRVKAVGLCGRDIVVWKGGFRNLKPPLILGHEVFGEHDGRPVSVYPAVNIGGVPLVLGENIPGGYADTVYVPEENLIPLPDAEYEKYAAAVCGVATLMHASRVAGIAAGDRVLVTGATGGVGIHGVQYLRLLGAEVVAYARSREKGRVLEEMGFDVVYELSFYKEKGRVDSVMEIVGAPTINESMRSLRTGGRLVLIGNITGEPITITRPALLVMREISVTGSAAFTRREWEAAIRVVASGAIRPVYKVYPLSRINDAYREALTGSRVGRIVLKP